MSSLIDGKACYIAIWLRHRTKLSHAVPLRTRCSIARYLVSAPRPTPNFWSCLTHRHGRTIACAIHAGHCAMGPGVSLSAPRGPGLRSGKYRVPGAMQRVALAKRCFAEPGPRFSRRALREELRAALRPGHECVITPAPADHGAPLRRHSPPLLPHHPARRNASPTRKTPAPSAAPGSPPRSCRP
jgi:hypothetical protein